ncbi:hypothetical protein [Ruania rhizosphaerae]|uniref:hypothetical protein n=1 Tax=Ruania rhizosphaerae TaxID=1840413 RepID=UPI00135A96CD|nr:hypothetical protein [Ruania rhizosphaerae]
MSRNWDEWNHREDLLAVARMSSRKMFHESMAAHDAKLRAEVADLEERLRHAQANAEHRRDQRDRLAEENARLRAPGALADAVARVTPCSCSAQRTRADRLAEKVQRLRDLAEWHETKAEKARRFPGGPDHAAVMAKTAHVHYDAAGRIYAALDDDTDGGGDRG